MILLRAQLIKAYTQHQGEERRVYSNIKPQPILASVSRRLLRLLFHTPRSGEKRQPEIWLFSQAIATLLYFVMTRAFIVNKQVGTSLQRQKCSFYFYQFYLFLLIFQFLTREIFAQLQLLIIFLSISSRRYRSFCYTKNKICYSTPV